MTAEEAAKLLGVGVRVKTALYRHFDADGVLLYVGISLAPFRRLRDHKRSHWCESIVTIKVEWHPDRESALRAEMAAIMAEQPLHNIDWNGPIVYCEQSEDSKAKERASQAVRVFKKAVRKRARPEVSPEEIRAAIATIGIRRP